MYWKPWRLLGAIALCLVVASTQMATAEPSDIDLQDVLDQYIAENYARSAAAVLITDDVTQYAYAGEPGPQDSSLFQIGSVTKTFNGLLLAQLVSDGRVELHTTLGELLGDRLELDDQVETITLSELATHSSGLPALGSMVLGHLQVHQSRARCVE